MGGEVPGTISVIGLLCLALFIAELAWTSPLGVSEYRAVHVPPLRKSNRWDLSKMFIWPNSYYDIPKHRYPYYDEHGKGKLLYGYGGQTLYKYSIFNPLEGYYRR